MREKVNWRISVENVGEIIEQFHEIAIGITELFDVMLRVSKGELNSRVTGQSQVEIIGVIKNVTNHMTEEIDRGIKKLKASEEAIQNLEEIKASILDAIPHAIIGLRDRKIFFANKSVEKVFGWQPEELIGKKTRVLYRNDEEFEEIGKSEFPCRRKDGKYILCTVSASVIGKAMQEKGIVVLYEDITNQAIMRKKLEESEKKYIDLYQNAPDGYHSLGPDGTILEVNDTWLKILGYDREEVEGKMDIKDLLTDEGKQIFQRIFPLLKEKGFVEKKDGTLIPVIINATAIYDDNSKFLKSRTIVRDNSEKKHMNKSSNM